MGLRPVQMAGRLGMTLTEYGALEAGELHIDYDLYLRSWTCAGGAVGRTPGHPGGSSVGSLRLVPLGVLNP